MELEHGTVSVFHHYDQEDGHWIELRAPCDRRAISFVVEQRKGSSSDSALISSLVSSAFWHARLPGWQEISVGDPELDLRFRIAGKDQVKLIELLMNAKIREFVLSWRPSWEYFRCRRHELRAKVKGLYTPEDSSLPLQELYGLRLASLFYDSEKHTDPKFDHLAHLLGLFNETLKQFRS